MKFPPFPLLDRLRQAPATANFGWLVVDKIIRLVLGLVVGLWVARYLGPAQYGVMTYGVAVSSIAAVLPTLGLDAIVRRQLLRLPDQTGPLLGTTFFLRLAVGMVVYPAVVIGAFLWEPDPAGRLAITMSGVSLVLQSLLTIDLWFQSQLLSKFTVVANNVTFVICSGLRLVGVLLHAPLSWFLYLLALEACLSSGLLVLAYRRAKQRLATWRFDGGLARELVRESWPLAIAAMAIMIYVRVDQVMLRTLIGPSETGTYGAAARITEILYSLPIMLAASVSPGLVRIRETDTLEYERRMRRFFNLAAGSAWLATLLCAGTAPWTMPLLFGPAYTGSTTMLIVLAFSLPFVAMGVARQEYLINAGQQRFQLATTIVGAVANVGLNLWAIPRWGGLGAAAITVVSHFLADLATSFFWSSAREAGRWQLRALAGWWRLPPTPVSPAN